MNYSELPKDKFGFGVKEMAVYYQGFYCEFYLPERELKRDAELGYKFLSDPKKVKFLVHETKKAIKHLKKDIDELVKINFKNVSNAELYKIYSSWLRGRVILLILDTNENGYI